MGKESEWISVKDRLPEEYARVMVFLSNESEPTMDADRLVNSRFVRYGWKVTYWMPLPEPPGKAEP